MVDSEGVTGLYNSIAIDSQDSPHISYGVRFPNWDFKYASRTGTNWTIETIDYTGYVGEFSSIAIDSHDSPHVSYRDVSNQALKYARRTGDNWSIETVDSGSVLLYTSIALDSGDNPHIGYGANRDLKYAKRTGSDWSIEIVDSDGLVGDYVSLALDGNDNPHLSYLDISNRNLKYATKAELVPPSRSISLDIDPDTLNLKSKGRWITAYLSAENASVHDINVSTILLQDALAPERWDYQDDVLVLKFSRQDFKDTVQVGESVQVKITGKWEDGSAFEAFDLLRVMNPGK